MAPPSNADEPSLAEARLAVLAAVVEGDAGTAFDVVGGLMSEGHGFETILFDVIAPLQSDVGKRWYQGDFAIAEEHAATGAIETLVALLAGTLLVPTEGDRVIVVTAEGDAHSLPARMLAAYLLYLGWRVTYLGASVPAADLTPYLESVRPAAVVVSCAIPTRLAGARATVKAAHAAGVPVLVGGRAFGDNDRRARRVGADGWARGPGDVDTTLRTWSPDPSAIEAAHRAPADLELLNRKRLQVLGAAAGNIDDGQGTDTDLELLFDALIAAILVDEPGVVAEVAGWRDRLESPQRGSGDAARLLGALETAIAPHSATAASYLAEAVLALGHD